MPTTVSCPHCNGQIVADLRIAGREVGCPHCNGRVVMPAAPAPAPPLMPPPVVKPILPARPVHQPAASPLDFLDSPQEQSPPAPPQQQASSEPLDFLGQATPTAAHATPATSSYRPPPKKVAAQPWQIIAGAVVVVCLLGGVIAVIGGGSRGGLPGGIGGMSKNDFVSKVRNHSRSIAPQGGDYGPTEIVYQHGLNEAEADLGTPDSIVSIDGVNHIWTYKFSDGFVQLKVFYAEADPQHDNNNQILVSKIGINTY